MTLPFRVYCLWLGPHQMSNQRKHCLQSIRSSIGVPVELIIDETLEDYILPEYPLHKGFQYLSPTTQCDYFRAYLMHHYGGGYTDIKINLHSWLPYFYALSNQPTKYIQGYREVGDWGVANLSQSQSELQQSLKDNWFNLAGNGAFICKPYSPFTTAWMNKLNEAMDLYYPDLIQNPAQDQRDHLGKDLNGTPSQFPIPWGGVGGAVFHPTCLEQKQHILYELPPVICANYL
jgi:hypothetical protein